jgi:hypothetical protein
MKSPEDLAALEQSLTIALADPKRQQQIRSMLENRSPGSRHMAVNFARSS